MTMDDTRFETDIAVIGMAGRFAGASTLDQYWRNLRDGVESLTRFTDEELLAAGVAPSMLADPNYVRVGAVLPEMEQFDARFFGFSPREASIMDPQHRHFLEVSWQALEDAGHVPDRFEGSIGMFGGSGHNAYLPYNLMTNPKLMQQLGFFLVRHTGNDKDFLTTRVSYLLNLKGPSVNVQTACSTSLVAIHLGVQSLLNRECDMALAGGVTIELPHRQGYLYRESEILSPDGHCHAFDADSKGTVFGSGVGVVVLRRLADALRDGDHIHAVIKGSAVNNDGALKVGYMAPSVEGQAQAIAEALALADVPPETITYVEAHGTGTPVGDPIEVAALTQAFRQGTQGTDRVGWCGIGSVKSNIGHTDTAAGVASFIKVALAMQHGELPPTLHFSKPNPACDFERSPFYVNAVRKAWLPPLGVPRRAGVSSLGVGGTNAHIVLEQAPRRASSSASRPFQLLVQSAKTPSALDAASRALADQLRGQPELPLADVAHTLQIGRQAMSQRRAFVARDAADAAQALDSRDAQRVFTDSVADGAVRSVAFMFAGGGAQYPNMGLDLYRDEPVYRSAVDECLTLLERDQGLSLRETMFPAPGTQAQAARALERPSLALPALLTTQYAQARLWMSWGIEPATMIGHSMGEYTAAHLAGVFSLSDTLALVALRGRLFETLAEGAMLSVPVAEDELRALMTPELSIAVINGPRMTVAAGPVQAIEALQQRLAQQDIEAARVRINVAAHSSMLEPILDEFGAFLRGIPMHAPKLPFVSNLSGTWIEAAEATDPAYWVKHLRRTVRFAQGLEALLADASRVLLEVGPGRTLSSLARQHPSRQPGHAVINGMRHPDDVASDQAFMLGALGRLWTAGVEIDWARLRGDEQRLRVPLPGYCFDHQRHWVEPGTAAVAAEQASLHKRQDIAQWFYQPVWQRTPVPRPLVRDAAAKPRRTLVMADALGFGERLAMRLTAAGDDVVVVRAGRWYRREAPSRYTISPRSAADLDRLLSALIGGGFVPDRIVHLWTLTGTQPAVLDELQHLGFYALLSLAQAIGREDLSDPMRLMVVTNRLQRVTTETGLEPAKATLLGPCNVIPREFPNVSSLCVDIDLPTPGSRAEQMLLDGLLGDLDGQDDDAVAWRGGERWVQSHEPMPLPAGRSRLREHGTYLITGGLGGVGLALAEHLATAVKARLVLLGRHALPERSEWSRHLARPDTDPALARRLRHVMALESLGAEVMVVAADVTQLAPLKTALRQARARFGPLHGVLHTAGVLDDGAIQLKEPSAAAAVLAPKVQGTLALEAALEQVQSKKEPLDFLMLFSSISAFAGLAGQIDYASANAFLDAYAQSRMHRDGTPTVAVNWSQWQEVGMAAELARHLGLQADTLRDSDGVEIGHPLVQRCLLDTPAERVYAARLSAASHWLLDEHRVRGGEALIPGTGYLEIVRTAFALQAAGSPGAAVELRNVVFLAPFVVRSGEERDLRVHIRAQGAAGNAFSIVGREAGAAHADDAWVEHVHGTVGWVAEAVDAARLNESAADIAARCKRTTQIGPSAQAHLQFGERWSSVRRIDFGEREALATLELPPPYAEDLSAFPLHPALMDMATGGAQSLIPGFEASRDFFVPAFYGRVRVRAPLTATLTSHVRWRADESGSDDLASFDVTVRDAHGRVAVEINDFTMIRVRDKALLARVATPMGAEAVPHKPRALANHVLLGQHEGILSAEGAEVVERVLSSGAGPQVVVSPQDLKVLMAQWRAPAVAAQAETHEAEGAAQAGFNAPVTATEKMIAQLWSEMLGHARVGADDDFFDLGGHSLLAVQLINKLKKKTGRALPLTALLEAPTVRTLAALIEPPASAGADAAAPQPSEAAALPLPAATAVPRSATLVTIRSGSADKLPVFFIHDGLGETLLYRNLALKLQSGHAVYGIQPEVDAHGVFAQSSIRGWASAHIRVMRSVQPQGPYLLAGLCAGGVVAFEMARQLEDVGERTQYVGIMDAADTQAEERALRVAHERWGRLRRVFEDDGSGLPAWRRAGRGVRLLGAKAFNLARYEWSSRLKRWANERKASRLGVQVSAGEAPSAESALPFLHLYEFAHRRHLPQGVFSAGRVVLYRAMEGDGTPGDEPYVDQYADPLFGWGPRVAGSVAMVDVPGGHASLLQEPNVGVLARHMRADIERALADVTTAIPLPLPATAPSAVAPAPPRETPATAEA